METSNASASTTQIRELPRAHCHLGSEAWNLWGGVGVENSLAVALEMRVQTV